MFRIKICVTLIVLLIGCVGRPITQQPGMSSQIRSESAASTQTEKANSPSSRGPIFPLSQSPLWKNGASEKE